MDLNEKIAARRRELDLEAEQARIANEKKIESEKREQQAAIISEVHRRAEQNIELPGDAAIEKASMTDAEFEKALSKAASDRMTSGENGFFAILVICCIGGFFIAWWVGLGFMLWAGYYVSSKTEHYKKQIIAEGKRHKHQQETTTERAGA